MRNQVLFPNFVRFALSITGLRFSTLNPDSSGAFKQISLFLCSALRRYCVTGILPMYPDCILILKNVNRIISVPDASLGLLAIVDIRVPSTLALVEF